MCIVSDCSQSQLARLDTDVLPVCLIKILKNARIVKVGRAIKRDITQLANDYAVTLPYSNSLDLLLVCKEFYQETPGQGSLQALAETTLGLWVDKTARRSSESPS